MDMSMDDYEVNDLKDWWEGDLAVSKSKSNLLSSHEYPRRQSRKRTLYEPHKNLGEESTWAYYIICNPHHPPTRFFFNKLQMKTFDDVKVHPDKAS